VREAVVGDIRTLVELMADFYAESDYVLDRARADAAFTALLSDPRLGRVWLIEQAAAAVGYVVARFVYGMEYGGLMAFVDDFFVRPAFRNSGLGSAALAAARDACAMLGVRHGGRGRRQQRLRAGRVPAHRLCDDRPQAHGPRAGRADARAVVAERRIWRSHQQRLWYNVAI
jgi:GNAT superfamily N-acetyltransferase